jgi:gliding motility associated protien GldN
MNKFVCVLAMVVMAFTMEKPEAIAQERPSGYNENSVRPVHEDYIMYKKRVWRRMDLREKQNRPFFARNSEITRVIIDAVKDGRLFPYKSDSLTERMSREEFLENLKTPDSEIGLTDDEREMGFGQPPASGWGDAWGTEQQQGPIVHYFFPHEITLLNIVEDVFFDRIRSRQYWDIQAIEMIIPADKIPTGLERRVATFKFIDLERLFRTMPEEAIWYNPQNAAQHRNLADAFQLRLFSARITKVENPEDLQIIDIQGLNDPRRSLYASQEMEFRLMEYEHDLWEY